MTASSAEPIVVYGTRVLSELAPPSLSSRSAFNEPPDAPGLFTGSPGHLFVSREMQNSTVCPAANSARSRLFNASALDRMNALCTHTR